MSHTLALRRRLPTRMAHEIAKMLLEHAQTFLARQEAIAAALNLGMPLNEIEDYLDWLDLMGRFPPGGDEGSAGPDDANGETS